MPAENWASYFWPNTTVLNNKLGIRNRDDLQTQEYQFVAARQAEIELGRVAIAPTYDATHLRTIHRHLFQDLYDWAGEYRTVPLAKGISEFAPANRISSYLDGAAAIVDNTSWPRLPADEFAGTMAKVYAWANHAHPFREGNGRDQTLADRDRQPVAVAHRLRAGRCRRMEPGGCTVRPRPRAAHARPRHSDSGVHRHDHATPRPSTSSRATAIVHRPNEDHRPTPHRTVRPTHHRAGSTGS